MSMFVFLFSVLTYVNMSVTNLLLYFLFFCGVD